MTDLVAENISVVAANSTLISDASLMIRPGELVAILGANGAGKTTLLRAMLGLQPTSSGSSKLDDIDCSDLSASRRARKISYLPQRRPLAWPNKVKDIVALGRFAHGAALGRLSHDDDAAVQDAIQACDLVSLSDRNADSLSGGELARVHFARAIAAQTPLLIADEPVAALDPRHQIRVAELIRAFVDSGGGALVVLHDIALAAKFADRLVWMKRGKIIVEGSPAETLTTQLVEDVYDVRAHVRFDEHGPDVRIQRAPN